MSHVVIMILNCYQSFTLSTNFPHNLKFFTFPQCTFCFQILRKKKHQQFGYINRKLVKLCFLVCFSLSLGQYIHCDLSHGHSLLFLVGQSPCVNYPGFPERWSCHSSSAYLTNKQKNRRSQNHTLTMQNNINTISKFFTFTVQF